MGIRTGTLTLAVLSVIAVAAPVSASPVHERSPQRGLEGFQPTAMAFPDATTGYVLGYAQDGGFLRARIERRAIIARTDDGGLTWTRRPAPNVPGLGPGLAFATPDVGFLSTRSRGFFMTIDGAAHWRRVSRVDRVLDVDVAVGKVWLLAHPCPDCTRTRLYAAPIGSAKFTKVHGGPRFHHGGVRFIQGTGDELYLVNTPKLHRGRLLRSYRGGPWTRQREPCRSFGSFTEWADAGLAVVCNTILYGAGNEAKQAYISFDGAHSWAKRGAPYDAGYIYDLAAADSKTWVLSEARTAFQVTTDGGATWEWPRVHVPSLGDGIGPVQFLTATHAVALPAYQPDRVFLHSEDAGLTWHTYRFPWWPMPRCLARQLTITTGPLEGAGGAGSTVLRVTNTSRHRCDLDGYVGIRFRNGHGRRLPLRVHRRGTPQRVRLGPRKSASAELGWDDNSVTVHGRTTRCPAVRVLRVTAPGDHHAIRVVPGKGGRYGRYVIHPCTRDLTETPLRTR